jgi:pimeloyl-ACP methyl ester carboxylesterase
MEASDGGQDPLAGRHDRTCSVGASEDMARRLPNAELVVFEDSAHMMFATRSWA